MRDTGYWEIWIDDLDGELAMDKNDMAMRKVGVVESEIFEKRCKQLDVAIKCLEKYRTLVIQNAKSPTYRLGKHAEDALNLMGAINAK